MAKRTKSKGDETVEAVDELLSVAPEDFVAARNAKVKELKAAGQREQAALVAALRRPTAVDWALNVVAGEHDDEVTRFVQAATAGRDAQAAAAEGRRGDDLRAALDDVRQASAEVARLAEHVLARTGTSASTQPAAITSRLVAVAANAALAEQLQRRALGFAAAGETDDELFAGLTAPAGRRAKPSPPRSRGEDAEPERTRGADAGEQRQRRQALKAAERAHAQAETAAAKAATLVRAAERDVTTAQERLAAAEAAVRDAEASLAEATEEHDRVSAEVEEAAGAVAAACEAVADVEV